MVGQQMTESNEVQRQGREEKGVCVLPMVNKRGNGVYKAGIKKKQERHGDEGGGGGGWRLSGVRP